MTRQERGQTILASRGNGWAHVWLSKRLTSGDVLPALAEVGLSPDVTDSPRGRDVLIYRRTLTDDEVATIDKAARLARMRPT